MLPGHAHRILIVEDTVSMAELYRAYLAKAGFECDIAGTGAEALAILVPLLVSFF